MKNSLLLIMTPNMSLEKWNERGQLSRELSFYKDLCERANLNLLIFSYGRNDKNFIDKYPQFELLQMFGWIPKKLPYTVQNIIYHFSALILYRKYFKETLIAKTNQFRAARFGLLLKFIFNIPLVVRMGFYHSHFKKLSLKKRLEEKFTFRMCDLILTTSFEAGTFIENTYSIPHEKILSMWNAVDLETFKPLNVAKEYDVIFVGRLEPVKNIELLLDVLDKTPLKALLIGSGSLNDRVRSFVNAHPNVDWKERVNNTDLPVWYNKSRCFILLSAYEGNPKALLEAMACGLTAVGTRVPGIRECIENNISGHLTEADAGQIRKVLLNILTDEVETRQMGELALAWVKKESNLKENIDKEIDFYNVHLKRHKTSYAAESDRQLFQSKL